MRGPQRCVLRSEAFFEKKARFPNEKSRCFGNRRVFSASMLQIVISACASASDFYQRTSFSATLASVSAGTLNDKCVVPRREGYPGAKAALITILKLSAEFYKRRNAVSATKRRKFSSFHWQRSHIFNFHWPGKKFRIFTQTYRKPRIKHVFASKIHFFLWKNRIERSFLVILGDFSKNVRRFKSRKRYKCRKFYKRRNAICAGNAISAETL